MSEEPSTIIRPGGITYDHAAKTAIRRAVDAGCMIIAGAYIEGDFKIVIPDDEQPHAVIGNWLARPEREGES